MKFFRLLVSLCTGISVLCSVAFAATQWFPESEMYIGGVGHGCTLEYVKSVYGEPKEKQWFYNDGVRGVRYVYKPTFSITATVKNDDPTPENKLQVTNVNTKASGPATPNGIMVGIPFQTVAGMYGMGEKMQYTDRVFYYYKLKDTNRAMTFYVNQSGIITEMIYAEEW